MRTLDAARLNMVANDPNVRPLLGGEGPIDLSPLVSDPANYALVGPDGGFLYVRLGDGLYEVHTTHRGRPRAVLREALESLEYMFVHTDCNTVWTKTPHSAAQHLCDLTGFRQLHGDLRALTLDEWALTSPATLRAGKEFHNALEIKSHADDPLHDRIAGAAYLMMANNPHKAVWFYNRMAQFLWGPNSTIRLISLSPLVVDIRDAVLEIGSGLKVLLRTSV